MSELDPDAVIEEIENSESLPRRKKHRRVIRKGGEQVLESEAVASFRLADDSVKSAPQALSGNDAALLENVPPHWGKR